MNARAAMVLLMATVSLLGAGVWRLFDLRFATGDVYPPASSLRADRLGTRALFESLALIPGRRVSQSLLPLSTIRGGSGTALFLLGVDPDDPGLTPRDRGVLDDLLANGTRIVVTLGSPRIASVSTNPPPAVAPPAGATPTDAPFLPPLGIRRDMATVSAVRTAAAPLSLPGQIPWRGPVFQQAPDPWIPLYTRDGEPVLLQRTVGRGTVVVLASTELLTNDALRHDRQTALLAWLAGDASRILFDETHLGTRLDPGIMTLIRRYGLAGVVLSLLLVAALALWRNTTSLIPRRTAPRIGVDEVVTGHDATAAFTHLLQRSVSPPELLPLCLAEWQRSLPPNRPDLRRKAPALQDLINLEAARPRRAQDPVRIYRQIAELLSRP